MKKENKLDINEEYEKLVPPTVRKSLFDESEDYDSLREYIMSQPYNTLKKRKLPFSDIELIDYIDFRRGELIDQETAAHKHLFFIKQSVKGKPEFCNAVGYYLKQTKGFVVMPYSYIVAYANGKVPLPSLRLGNNNMDGVNRYISTSISFISPGDAASFVLGHKAGLDEWVDRRGKGLLEYYSELVAKPILVPEEVIEPENDSHTPQLSKKPVAFDKHLFYIKVKRVCDASGYYNPENGYFYICKDSFIALNSDKEYEESPSGKARARLIASVCTKSHLFYNVIRDAKCRSASAAASYVLGEDSSFVEWEDENGKGLKDYYPEHFSDKKTDDKQQNLFFSIDKSPVQSPVKKKNEATPFYIKYEMENGNRCQASGFYDQSNKVFVLKEGSQLATTSSRDLIYTVEASERRVLILKNCRVLDGVFTLIRDVECDSPSKAAFYVLGRKANGLEEWKDGGGNTLRRFKEILSIRNDECK